MKKLIPLVVLVCAILIAGKTTAGALNRCWSAYQIKTKDLYLHNGEFFRRFTAQPFTGKGIFKVWDLEVIHVPIKDGVMNGEMIWYYETEEIKQRGMVRDNFFVGKHTTYKKSGKIESVTTYSNKCLKLVEKSFFINGKVRKIFEEIWDEKRNSWKTNVLKTFKVNGELASELDSKGDGKIIEYDDEGKVLYKIFYKNFETENRLGKPWEIITD